MPTDRATEIVARTAVSGFESLVGLVGSSTTDTK